MRFTHKNFEVRLYLKKNFEETRPNSCHHYTFSLSAIFFFDMARTKQTLRSKKYDQATPTSQYKKSSSGSFLKVDSSTTSRTKRTCGNCKQVGHDRRTCPSNTVAKERRGSSLVYTTPQPVSTVSMSLNHQHTRPSDMEEEAARIGRFAIAPSPCTRAIVFKQHYAEERLLSASDNNIVNTSSGRIEFRVLLCSRLFN